MASRVQGCGRRLVVLVLYATATTALPLVHNAWHGHRHHHGLLHRHPGPVVAAGHHHGHPTGHLHREPGGHGHTHHHRPGHHTPLAAHGHPGGKGSGPPAPASDPDHGHGSAAHFGTALGPAPLVLPVPTPALAPARLSHADTSVYRPTHRRGPANPRAPPLLG